MTYNLNVFLNYKLQAQIALKKRMKILIHTRNKNHYEK